MDDSLFDNVTRSLVRADRLPPRTTRRGVARVLTGLAVAAGLGPLLALPDHAAGRRKKKRKKPSPRCLPACGGRNCGDDGCGRTCGVCTGGQSCLGGVCTCPSGQDFCGGLCRDPCPRERVRNTISCGCCRPSGRLERTCDPAELDPCCSGLTCRYVNADRTDCPGRQLNDACSFGAQCASGYCNPNLVCA